MKNLKILAFTLFAFCIAQKSYPQKFGSIQLGAAVPMMEFAEHNTIDNAHGGASTGFNVGLQYVYQFPECHFGIFGGIDFNYNGLQHDYRDKIEFRYGSMRFKASNARYSAYLNAPITAGLNYTLTNDNIGVFANAGLAVNILKISDMEIEVYDETLIQEMALAHGFGYKVGGGIIFNRDITISVDYLALGKHTIESHAKRDGYWGSLANEDYKLKVNMLTVTLGYRFE